MARFMTPTQEMVDSYTVWVAERPDTVRVVAERFDPWTLYKMKSTGHRVVVYCFDEAVNITTSERLGVTLQVDVLGRFNRLVMERRVFGVAPDDLGECDLPAPDELVGVVGDTAPYWRVAEKHARIARQHASTRVN